MGVLSYPASYVVPGVALAATALVCFFILAPGQHGYGAGVLFAYHAVFMVGAFLLALPLGLVSYAFDFGPRGNAAYPSTGARRVLHGTANMLAAFLALCGYLVAFVWHQARGQSHLALDATEKTRTAHVWLGMLALAGVAFQSGVGLWKLVKLTREGRKTATYHGKVGPAVFLVGLTCICLAAWFEYKENSPTNVSWSLGQVAAIWTAVAAVGGAVLATLYLAPRAHVASDKGVSVGYSVIEEEDADVPYASVRLTSRK